MYSSAFVSSKNSASEINANAEYIAKARDPGWFDVNLSEHPVLCRKAYNFDLYYSQSLCYYICNLWRLTFNASALNGRITTCCHLVHHRKRKRYQKAFDTAKWDCIDPGWTFLHMLRTLYSQALSGQEHWFCFIILICGPVYILLFSKGSAVGCGPTRWKLIQSQRGGRWLQILQVMATISKCRFSAQTCTVFWFQMASYKHLGLALIPDHQGCCLVLRSGVGTKPLHSALVSAWMLRN